ncbi:MAG TPA: hypothetical protein VM266_04630 [Solirubrobacteraceae bacterium]|nr:hypothetical protein [Solirubrobacteraceae bacterium]
MPRRRLAAVALAALAASGCGGSDPPPRAAGTPAPTASPCDAARPDDPIPAPERLVTPRGTLVDEVASLPPNTKVSGYVPLEPDEFVRRMTRRRGLRVLFKEAEGTDAEVLVTDGRERSFWKVVLACPGGSRFTVLTGEETTPGAFRAGRG